MERQRFKLSTIIIFFVCLVVLVSLIMTDLLISNSVSQNIRDSQEEKAIIVSRTVAKSPVVRLGLQNEGAAERIQKYAMEIQQATGVMFIVVMDMNGIRKSHPNSELIGKRFVGGDEKAVLEGREHISTSTGTLGESLRAFTPIYNTENVQIGAVAVGISLENVQEALESSHDNILLGSLIGILAGVAGAILLAKYIKRILLGLEPSAIAKILVERSTMLQSVHEGIIAVDQDSQITLVNKSALRIFRNANLPGNPVGMKINDYMPSTKLDRVLKTGRAELDEELTINGVSILVNRVPLLVNDQVVGAISTFRDKTEVNRLAEQLTGVRTYAESLRAQSHEFMNKLHVILGMVRMGYHEELLRFISKLVDHRNQEAGMITRNIKEPALAGFLMGKLSYAREENVELNIINETVIPEPHKDEITHELITIIGNLIDNAVEAFDENKDRSISLHLKYAQQQLYIKVTDSGPGISEDILDKVFERGFSTKGTNRGYGLYLVKQSIERLGGKIKVHNGRQMEIQATVPYIAEVKDDD
ncbi:DcuS/MalK family sensor histidine kinase [Cytobacillus sp. NCCP-133]|uniref:DcuS/MalK family sensor histidine kinase n=1 Tax=Cytobacillus sp. NCCP-133 TaxID=766848 RepID=UPI00222E9C4D|nr:DcuS/MalK family sensor histidine kinase [Cytobacillus sp. NCCP-133]GLB61063.1 two-component system sensor histidine kinase DcuS [Cytobacillus sp. NCCP-133]